MGLGNMIGASLQGGSFGRGPIRTTEDARRRARCQALSVEDRHDDGRCQKRASPQRPAIKIMRAVSKLLFKSADEGGGTLFQSAEEVLHPDAESTCSQKGAKHACRDAFVTGSRMGTIVSGARLHSISNLEAGSLSHFSHCDRISSQDPTSRLSGRAGVPGEWCSGVADTHYTPRHADQLGTLASRTRSTRWHQNEGGPAAPLSRSSQ